MYFDRITWEKLQWRLFILPELWLAFYQQPLFLLFINFSHPSNVDLLQQIVRYSEAGSKAKPLVKFSTCHFLQLVTFWLNPVASKVLVKCSKDASLILKWPTLLVLFEGSPDLKLYMALEYNDKYCACRHFHLMPCTSRQAESQLCVFYLYCATHWEGSCRPGTVSVTD